MGAKHTLGPWNVELNSAGAWDVVNGEPDTYAPTVAQAWSMCGRCNPEANARLISAAPDLLEALTSLLPTNVNLDHPALSDDVTLPCDVSLGELRKARAAIAKALGRS